MQGAWPTNVPSWARDVAKLIAIAVLGGPLQAAPVKSADPPRRIDLGGGSLQQALTELAQRTGLQILYDPSLVQGQATRGIHGVMTPAKALQQLLASTPISFEFTAADAVALHQRSATAESSNAITAAQPERTRAVVISTDRLKRGAQDSSASMSSVKIDESQLLVPVSSAAIPQRILRDQQATGLEDVLEYVSATETVPVGRSSSGFVIRGFPTYQYYLDGIRISPDLHRDAFRDLSNIEQVDVLKGPASLLYGRTEPGGVINVTTKQPLATPMLSIEQRAGSFGRLGTLLDAGGPLSSTGSFLYRFNASWESNGSFRDIAASHRIFLAPVITWKSSDRTETTAYLEYLNSHDAADSGLPIIGNQLPRTPPNRSLDEGGDIHATDFRVGIRGSYSLADGWTLRHHLDMRWLHTPQAPQIALAADGLAPAQCSASSCPVERMVTAIPAARGSTTYASLEVLRDFALWRTAHTLLVGAEFFETASYSELRMASDPGLTTDLYQPPRNIPIPVLLLDNPDYETQLDVREQWVAAYVQDQIFLGKDLYMLAGLRFDNARASVAQTIGAFPDAEGFVGFQDLTARIKATKNRVGLIWHPVPWWSIYATRSENFGAVPGLFVSFAGNQGVFLQEQSATEVEVGVKLEPMNSHLDLTIAAFELKKSNISSPLFEPALNPLGELFFTGAAINKGLELDVHGEPLPHLECLANYAYIDSKIVNDSGPLAQISGIELVGETGNRLFGVPRNGGSTWCSYAFASQALHGLRLGAGMVARGSRYGDNANDYTLPGFAKWNTFAAYHWRVTDSQFSVQVNVDNVFNARYFESLNGTHTVMPAEPRRWLASFRVQF